MLIQRIEYGRSAYLLLHIDEDQIATVTIYGIVSIDILICMRSDMIERTGDFCVISDLSHCIITSADKIGVLFALAEVGRVRDRSCAWVVSPESARPWRLLSARMAYLGYSRRVFTALPAAFAWVQRELLLPAFEDHPRLLRC